MKTNKLLAAGALALSMTMTPVASLLNAMPVAAEGTIVVPTPGEGETQRTYTYYQIFTGTYKPGTNGTKTLVELKWGTDGKGDTGTAVSKADVDTLLALNENKSDRAVVDKILGSYLKEGATGTPITGSAKVADGYYLIKDTTKFDNNTQEATGLDVVQIIGGEYEIQKKTSVPTFEKKTKDINDSQSTVMTDWQDSGDFDFGDKVPFKLEATLGEKYDTYKAYQLIFNDTYDTNAFNTPENIVVKAGDTTLKDTDYTVENNGNGSLKVVVKNLKESAPNMVSGNKVTVEYEATLKETATLGAAVETQNRNQAWLEFTNNPDWDGKGESPKGETPKDQVRVFTYKLDVNKNLIGYEAQ